MRGRDIGVFVNFFGKCGFVKVVLGFDGRLNIVIEFYGKLNSYIEFFNNGKLDMK